MYYKNVETIQSEAWHWVVMNKWAHAHDDLYDSTLCEVNKARWDSSVSEAFKAKYQKPSDFLDLMQENGIQLHPDLIEVAGTIFTCAGRGQNEEEDQIFVRDNFSHKLGDDEKNEKVMRQVKFVKTCVGFAPSTALAGGSRISDSPGLADDDPFKTVAPKTAMDSGDYSSVLVVINRFIFRGMSRILEVLELEGQH